MVALNLVGADNSILASSGIFVTVPTFTPAALATAPNDREFGAP
jgi:hypothetical protein